MADRTFKLTFLGDASSATRAVGGLSKELGGVEKVAAGIGASRMLESLGATFTSQIVGSKNAASSLNEQMSKAQVVFGGSFDVMRKFADVNASAFNISKREAYQYGSQLGMVLKAGGATEQQAADMSLELLRAAGDLASFADIPLAEALQKIQSGLVGESEPLRSVGVLVDEATTAQKALQMGLKATAKELTIQDKVQARYALILEGLADSHGDVARTMDSTANQQRHMAVEAENTAATMGGPVNSAWNSVLQLWNGVPAVGRLVIQSGAMILGGLTVLAGFLPSITAGFSLMGAGIMGVFSWIASVGGTLLLGFGAMLGGVFTGLVAVITSPITILVGAFALGMVAAYKFTDLLAVLPEKLRVPMAILGQLLLAPFIALKEIIDSLGDLWQVATGKMSLSDMGKAAGARSQSRLGLTPTLDMTRFGGGEGEDVGGSTMRAYATGGIVGGPRGSAQLAIVHGGETILPTHKGGGFGNVTVNVMGNTMQSDSVLQRLILDALTTAQQRGSLGIA